MKNSHTHTNKLTHHSKKQKEYAEAVLVQQILWERQRPRALASTGGEAGGIFFGAVDGGCRISGDFIKGNRQVRVDCVHPKCFYFGAWNSLYVIHAIFTPRRGCVPFASDMCKVTVAMERSTKLSLAIPLSLFLSLSQ